MKREKREACNSKLWLCIASLICCCVYFAYYQALTIEVSSAVDLAISFDRDDVPSSLYGVCPLSRAADSHPITDFKRRNCTKSLPLTYLDKKGRIVVNKTVDEKIRKSCYARALNDRTSWPWTWLKAIAVFFIRNNKLFWYNSDEVDKIEDDLVEVECLGYNNFHGRVRRSEKIPIRFNASSDLFIIHVRSFRSNVFTPHTTRFLEEALSAVHFHNYQSLGDDYADFGAILAGGLATPLSREWMGRREVPTNLPRSYYDDPCFATRTSTFLPRVFQQEGYATLIADENNIQESGFERGCGWEPSNLYTPVLHRFPPKPGCSYASRVLEYFERFVEVYDASAKFVVLRILHDDSVVDEELLSFFKRLKKRLDKAYVFFIADVPGSTNPSPITTPTQNLWISLPKALRDALAMANLLANQHVLTHSFDVHETLRARARMIHGSSGSSLIEKLPAGVRDCARLPIPLQHCPCPVSMINYTDTATLFLATEAVLEPLNDLLHDIGCKRWDIQQIYGMKRIEKLPIVEIFVAVRPQEKNGFGKRYDNLDFPVLKLVGQETQTSSSLVFTGLPELSVALKPIDHSLSPCLKGHWLRPFCYCEAWTL